MEQYPSFVAPIGPKKADDDEESRDGAGDDRGEPAIYPELFSAREVKHDTR